MGGKKKDVGFCNADSLLKISETSYSEFYTGAGMLGIILLHMPCHLSVTHKTCSLTWVLGQILNFLFN